MTTVRVLLIAAVALFGVSCGREPVAAPPPAQATAASTTTTVPPRPTTTTRPPYTPPAGPLSATDGTNLKACAKGTCEVIVKKGDRIRFDATATGLVSLTVTDVTDTGFSLFVAMGRGGSSSLGGAIGGGELGSISSPANDGGRNQIVFASGDGKDGAVVLRLSFSEV
ncbi:hypothetical protein [Allokutzneria oryzae]|uniref:Uncharacterized protein n=1 Tax=Allokutzneria oryzae TaxID=1378989 RepID=A0ABV6A8A1_9PSEU